MNNIKKGDMFIQKPKSMAVLLDDESFSSNEFLIIEYLTTLSGNAYYLYEDIVLPKSETLQDFEPYGQMNAEDMYRLEQFNETGLVKYACEISKRLRAEQDRVTFLLSESDMKSYLPEMAPNGNQTGDLKNFDPELELACNLLDFYHQCMQDEHILDLGTVMLTGNAVQEPAME